MDIRGDRTKFVQVVEDETSPIDEDQSDDPYANCLMGFEDQDAAEQESIDHEDSLMDEEEIVRIQNLLNKREEKVDELEAEQRVPKHHEIDWDELDLENRIFPNHPGKKVVFYSDKEINTMKAAELVAACKKCGIKCSGRKIDMQSRLRCVKEMPEQLAKKLVLGLGPSALPFGCTFPQLLDRIVAMEVAHLEKVRKEMPLVKAGMNQKAFKLATDLHDREDADGKPLMFFLDQAKTDRSGCCHCHHRIAHHDWRIGESTMTTHQADEKRLKKTQSAIEMEEAETEQTTGNDRVRWWLPECWFERYNPGGPQIYEEKAANMVALMRKLNSKEGRWEFLSQQCTRLHDGQLRDPNVKIGKRGGIKKLQRFTKNDKQVLERLGVNTATPGKWRGIKASSGISAASTTVGHARNPHAPRGDAPKFDINEGDDDFSASASAAPPTVDRKMNSNKEKYMAKLQETEDLMKRLKMGKGIPSEKRIPEKKVWYDRDGFALAEPPVGYTEPDHAPMEAEPMPAEAPPRRRLRKVKDVISARAA